MTAAAVSYQIKQLEARLGTTLFLRHPRRVELTEGGEVIAPLVSKAFATLRQAFAHAADRSEAELSITTLPTVGGAWLAPKLGRFRDVHSRIEVKLDLSVTAADFATTGFDAAIRSGRGDWPGLRSYHLLPNVFAPVCSPSLIDVARVLERPAEPFGFQLLGRPSWWAKWYAALGMPDVDLGGRFGTRFDVEQLDVSAAVAGHGVAMVSPIFFRRELEAGSLVLAHDLVVSDGRAYWFTFPATRTGAAKLRAFKDWIVAEASEDLMAASAMIDGYVTVASD